VRGELRPLAGQHVQDEHISVRVAVLAGDGEPPAVRVPGPGHEVALVLHERRQLAREHVEHVDAPVLSARGVAGDRQAAPVGMEVADKELDVGAAGQVPRPAAGGWHAVELRLLAAVAVDADHESVRRPGVLPRDVLLEDRELAGPAALDGLPPEVHLAGAVVDVGNLVAVGRERQVGERLEPAHGVELLEPRARHQSLTPR
jgi:hypothetical protein